MVWRRDTTVLYRNQRTPHGSWERPAGAAGAVRTEHARPYTLREAARFRAVHRRLWEGLPRYRDELTRTAGLARQLMPAPHTHRLPGPTPADAALERYDAGPASPVSSLRRAV
jgi:hypothetical protein